eukprot:9436185-Ditylum_brightwellii.AAC.1
MKVYTYRDGIECWVMSSDKYVKIDVDEVERDVEKEGPKLKGKASCPYNVNYHSKIDVSQELDDDGVAKYQ